MKTRGEDTGTDPASSLLRLSEASAVPITRIQEKSGSATLSARSTGERDIRQKQLKHMLISSLSTIMRMIL